MDLERTIAQLAVRAGPGVVGLEGGARGGSGVVLAPGRVLTLARNLRGREAGLVFADGRRESAALAGADADLGLAVLEADTGEAPSPSWPDIPDAPPIGASVFALADPGGGGLRVTAGAVAAAPRSLRGPRGRLLEGLIEHTAPLPRGSAGGPLLDAQGRLLGLNAVRFAHGLILAVPAAGVRERLSELAAGSASSPRRLGVAVLPPRVARRLRGAVGLSERDGVLVRAVQPDSPAERAGVQRGDLIVSLAEREVDSLDALFSALDEVPLDRPAALRVLRGAEERKLSVQLEQG
jgi:serine protease Do